MPNLQFNFLAFRQNIKLLESKASEEKKKEAKHLNTEIALFSLAHRKCLDCSRGELFMYKYKTPFLTDSETSARGNFKLCFAHSVFVVLK